MRNPQSMAEAYEATEEEAARNADLLSEIEGIVQAHLDTSPDSVYYDPIATLEQLAVLLGLEQSIYTKSEDA